MRNVRPYQFCRLHSSGFLSFYNRVIRNNGILCFDLEDSINDPDEVLLKKLKQRQRIEIVDLLHSMNLEHEHNGVGIRINSARSKHFHEDLASINSIDALHSVFLPKVESPNELMELLAGLTVKVQEVIPVIETSKGFDCIEEILSVCSSRFTSICFGHCDFNLSKNCFPFFHQDSNEYWEWISFLNRKTEEAGKKLINSPVLRLDDEKLFLWVLNKLTEYPSVAGQATLSLRQTEWCSRERLRNSEPGRWKKARVPDFDIAVSIVTNFEKHRLEGKSFAVDNNRTVISPQEYLSARNYLGKFDEGKNILIVGGCLPIQYNIPRDGLYHRTLVNLLEQENIKANIAIIRYETLGSCMEKISTAIKNIHIDMLIFNLRTEPLMRMSKIFYKYFDDEGNLRHSLNLPYLKILNAEKYDPLAVKCLETNSALRKKETKRHHFLVESNCFLGSLIGNKNFALTKYAELTYSIMKFCIENGVELLVLGPATRPISKFENRLVEQINKKLSKTVNDAGFPYVDIIGTHDACGNYLFFENGLHVSQAGHDRIGKMIFEKIAGKILQVKLKS